MHMYTRSLLSLILSFFLLSACSTPEVTAPGTLIGEKDLSSFWSEEDKKSLQNIKATTFTKNFPIEDSDSLGRIDIQGVVHPTTMGQYLKHMRVSVVKNTDYTITMDSIGQATNMGTPETPIMTIPFMVHYTHKNRRSIGTSKMTIWANGKLEMR